jgi:hypothetical protein
MGYSPERAWLSSGTHYACRQKIFQGIEALKGRGFLSFLREYEIDLQCALHAGLTFVAKCVTG